MAFFGREVWFGASSDSVARCSLALIQCPTFGEEVQSVRRRVDNVYGANNFMRAAKLQVDSDLHLHGLSPEVETTLTVIVGERVRQYRLAAGMIG